MREWIAVRRLARRPLVLALRTALLGALGLGCAAVPPPPPSHAAPGPAVYVHFVPLRGQGPRRQERDRYECHLWAQRQSGFDPTRPGLAPHQRIVASPAPANTLLGGLFGALTGAIIGAPYHSGEGAAIGAAVGATAGAVQDIQVAEARRAQALRRFAQVERRAERYRRALEACLEGRGYRVY